MATRARARLRSVQLHQAHELNPRELRKLGLLTGSIVAGLFGLFLPWFYGAESVSPWPWIVSGVLVAWAIVAPAGLRPVYRGWMRVGSALGSVTTPVFLSILFILLIVPYGLMMRLFQEDRMHRKPDESLRSYRIESHRRTARHMERPF